MDLIITILPVVTKDLPIPPRFTPYSFLSRRKFSTLTTRQPMAEFYLLTFPRFPLRKKEHKSYFGKNRTHDFRTSRCAGYLLVRTRYTLKSLQVSISTRTDHSSYCSTEHVIIHRGMNTVQAEVGGSYTVCMYGHTYSKSKDQPGKAVNPARGQLNRENEYLPVPVRA